MNDASTTQGAKVAVRLVEETDSYTASVAGATVGAIRIGRGTGPNRVLAIRRKKLALTKVKVGFPMHAFSELAENRVLVIYISDAPGESRWCGSRLRPDSVMVYGPGASHVGLNQPGLSFTFVATELDRLQALGELLGEPFRPPPGGLSDFSSSPVTADVRATLGAFASAALDGRSLEAYSEALERSVVSLLAAPNRGREVGVTRGIDSRAIVLGCIDFAEVIGRIPTISELCLAAHVSERRLRAAFTEEFDEPPSRFFRNWALERARRRLSEEGPAKSTVTEVATGLGFDHLGRFAGYYRQLFGEAPSATLQARPTS